jgi:small-conductance mechanosensitive channel
MSLEQLLSLVAMFLLAGSPLLADTTPGSVRSIVVAVAGVALALSQLVHAIGPKNTQSSFRLHLVDRSDVVITILFTIVEVITLGAWLLLFLAGRSLESVAVLAVGLFIDHLISRLHD